MLCGWRRWLHRLFPQLLYPGLLYSALLCLGLMCPVIAATVPRPAAAQVPAQGQAGLTELRSSGGVLAVTLRAAEGKVHIGDLELDGATYNGLYAGPVLRVRPGDMLRIRLINDLSQPTNLHFHGIFTSPLGNGDNVHLSIAAGTSFTYEIRIPTTQPPGVYWYHSHLHGRSEWQVMRGLSGALVVDPAAEPSTARAAEHPGMAERLFVLKNIVFDDDIGNPKIDDELHGVVQSINGALDTSETMRPGETQRWRFTNQSANLPIHIALQGHRFRIVAEDGEATIGEHVVDSLDIIPAGRVEVLVEAGAPGRYALLAKGMLTGRGSTRQPDRVLGHLDVRGDVTMPAAAPAVPPPPPDLRLTRIDARRTVVFSETTTLKADAQRFFINGQTFDANRIDFRVPLGNIEEWTVRNDSDDFHVFHIHQVSFQVVEINGAPVAFSGRTDTVQVPERGEVKLRMAFADEAILGQFVLHCHVLKHEDKGMMAMVEVYDPRPSALLGRMRRLYAHVWWWMHGVPWSLCGVSNA